MIGYLDLPSGLSGDMFLGCLIDAGWPLDDLGRTVTALGLPRNEWALDVRAVMKGPLRATLLTVQTAEPQTHEAADPGHASPPAPTAGLVGFHVFPQSADPIHLPGHHHHHDDAHGHAHSHAHDHPHDHGHGSHHHHHHGPQRRLADVRAIIESSSLSSTVKDRALAVFVRLAQAEAKVHGTTPDQIHFHEVGAVDAIIDIVGVVAGLDALGIDALYASSVPVGDGWVNTAHGRLPVPAPATLELLAAAGVPTRPSPSPGAGELLTPTGAALLAELATFHQPEMELRRIGIGAGRRDCAWPNIARLWLGELRQAGPMVQLETNIDDMNPQLYEPVMQQLLAAGASDVWLTPVQMKKGRPAVVLSVLAATPLESALTDIILRQTTTLGVRVHALSHRTKARREMRQVATAFGDVPVKVKWVGNDLVGAFPEFDDCRRLAEKHGVPVRTVHEAALAAAREAFPLSAAPTPPAAT